jgi:hypothetical protein
VGYQPGPNNLLRDARCAVRSPSGSGRPMSRQELAEAVAAYLYEQTGRVFSISATHVAALERGKHRWPAAHYRTAFRAVLGRDTDAALGFFIARRNRSDAPNAGADTAAVEPGDAGPVVAGVSVAPMAGPGAGGAVAEVWVSVSADAGTAVTLVCPDGPAGRVAVVAGGVRVLIEAPGTGRVSVVPAVADLPAVSGGARVYSLAERRAR